MKRILLDSDVILDLLLERQAFCDDANMLVLACEQKLFHGYMTPVSIANVYYIFRQNASHMKVIEQLQLLLKIIGILNMDQKQVLSALQYYSALNRNKIAAIITRNVKDFKKSALPVFSPAEFLATFN